MDIVTHAMVGGIIGFPLIPIAPAFAGGFIIGSVFPDLDAFSRCFGKKAFLQFHQSYTHSIPMIAFVVCLSVVIMKYTLPLLVMFPVGIGVGMIGHALLDLTNTYGIRILYPFSNKRFSFEWMFFVDSLVITLCRCGVIC